MTRGKKHIFGVLFFIYFLLYVVSPVCYTEDGLNEKIITTHGAKQDAKNLRVIWELILSKIAQKGNTENSGSGVQFFIKKARAVLSSNNITDIAHAEFETADFNVPTPCLISADTPPPLAVSKSQSGFYFSFSGLSPPVV